MLEKFKRKELKDKGVDKRAMKRELHKLKKETLKRGGRLPGNEQENIDGGEKLLKLAKADKAKKEDAMQKDREAWAKDEATFVAKCIKNAVTVTGGFGPGRRNKCDYCGEGGNRMRGEFDKEHKKYMFKCESCRKQELYAQDKHYLKIIVH